MFDLIKFLANNNINNISFYSDEAKLQCECPIHDNADNIKGFVFYYNEQPSQSQWRCFTRQCHDKYQSNLYGLICAILKRKISSNEYIKLINDYNNENQNENQNETQNETQNEIKNYNILPVVEQLPLTYCKEIYQWGYNEDFAKLHYFGGIVNTNGYINKIAFAVYDRNNRLVGYTFRLLDKHRSWLLKKTGILPGKWLHQKGLKTSRILYGENLFPKDINTAILTESPKDTLFLIKNGFHNVLGTFGLGITRSQENNLIQMGIHNIIYLYDSDKAGNGYFQGANFNRTCKLFNVKVATSLMPRETDPDELTKSQLLAILS